MKPVNKRETAELFKSLNRVAEDCHYAQEIRTELTTRGVF